MVNALRRIVKHGCRFQPGLIYVMLRPVDLMLFILVRQRKDGDIRIDAHAAMVIAEESGYTIRSLKRSDYDENVNVSPESKFNICSKSMICGLNKKVIEQCRKFVLDL